MHANVYDQDQGLMGRYHNTTLDTNRNNTSFILQTRGLEGSNTSLIHKRQQKQQYLSTDIKLDKDALRMLAQKKHDRRGKASCLGASSLLLVVGGLHVVLGTLGVVVVMGSGIWLLGSVI